MILIGSDFIPLVECCKIKPAVIDCTDHQSVFMKFRTGASEKGRGYWKINNSILEDNDYIQLVNKEMKSCFMSNRNLKNLGLAWDIFKIKVREATIAYCKSKAKFARENLRTLEKKLEIKLKIRDEQESENNYLDKDIEELENNIAKIYEQKAKGAQIRSRERF